MTSRQYSARRFAAGNCSNVRHPARAVGSQAPFVIKLPFEDLSVNECFCLFRYRATCVFAGQYSVRAFMPPKH